MKLSEYLSEPTIVAKDFAASIGIPGALLSQWRNEIRQIPLDRCYAIEQATAGAVTRKDLRPDDWMNIWPELADKETV